MGGKSHNGAEMDIFELGDWNVLPAMGHPGPVAIAAGEANARLIASAPDLLETANGDAVALDEAANVLAGVGLPGTARIMREQAERTRAVIARATGAPA